MEDLHLERVDYSVEPTIKLPSSEDIKFKDPFVTAKGEERAYVDLVNLETLWFNTGTLCNITCQNCYIESSPRNDRLVYLTHEEVLSYLNEIETQQLGTREVGITGGEPFMNPDIIKIMRSVLERKLQLIVLTNAMRPMMRFTKELLKLLEEFGPSFTLRVSVDHYKTKLHEEERGKNTWKPMLEGLQWLCQNGFDIDIAGRTRWHENEEDLRAGYASFFEDNGIALDAHDKKKLVLFPEMKRNKPTPEITTQCWSILNVNPDDIMCATSRMIVKRKGAEKPSVIACTLLPYDPQFEYASTLENSAKRVQLNHRFCSEFCVAGGGACSVKEG